MFAAILLFAGARAACVDEDVSACATFADCCPGEIGGPNCGTGCVFSEDEGKFICDWYIPVGPIMEMCPLTCGVCEPCVDKDPERCVKQAETKGCTNQRYWNNCQKTCGACTEWFPEGEGPEEDDDEVVGADEIDIDSSDVIDAIVEDPDCFDKKSATKCSKWFKKGKCEKSSKAQKGCKKTCGLCGARRLDSIMV